MSIVKVQDLTKRYGDFYALNECSLSVPEGSVFGLLGPNGAGKTTLIRSLLGYLKPTSGRAAIDGYDCVTQSLEVRQRVSYLPAETKLFRTMKGSSCIDFFSSIHPRGNRALAVDIADRLQLDLRRRVAFMSTGMRQKLAISCVMSCDSRVIILDEPTANLDPNVRQEILTLVKESQMRGATILFCSHVLSEIEEICDHAAFLRRGKVVESIQLANLPTVHRIRGGHRNANWLDHRPEECRVHSQSQHNFVIEISGDLTKHLRWIHNPDVYDITIEYTALRNIYDRVHKA